MSIRTFRFACLTAMAAFVVGVGAAQAGFNSFVIRNSSTSPFAPPAILTNNAYVPGAKEFVIAEGGQKAGYGSSDIDGNKLGEITKLAIVRHDDETRFTTGSGPAVAPYLNIWITDGTNYAVVANEPSNPDFQGLYNNGYDLDWSDISGKVAKIYENNDKSWLPNNGVGLTFADLANFTIKAPTAGELTTGWAGLGSGAPREIVTNQAYGVNWIFGDTLSNYVSAPSSEGFVVSGAQVQVPEPATLALAGLAGLGLFATSRRRRNG